MTRTARAAILIVAIVGAFSAMAVAFRYQTYNKSGPLTAKFDRWTGTMYLCGLYGCYSETELKPTYKADEASQPSVAQLADGTKLEFPAEIKTTSIQRAAKILATCSKLAQSQKQLERCYDPKVGTISTKLHYRIIQMGKWNDQAD